MRNRVGPAITAITALPLAWATSKGMPVAARVMNECRLALGPSVLQAHTSISQSNRNPQTMPYAASAQRFRSGRPIAAAPAPTSAQPIICHGVHGPWPRKAFETRAAAPPVAMPARAPRVAPVTATIIVTGCTLGMNANSTRPPAAAAASAATRASSRLRLGPVSTAEMASTTQPSAISSTMLDTGPLRLLAQQRPGLGDRRAAQRKSHLAGEEPALGEQVDGAAVGQHPAAGHRGDRLRRLRREVDVVRHHHHAAAIAGQAPHQLRQRQLAETVHPACGLVQDEQLWPHHSHR